ncbi:hypothetical protein AVEN_188348-1 [Araneus ventricosus]|uniref:Uncharacterized protein n=1 Tax=Araneus ventricosus TaxID=182803 RepID=A0A4Y2W9I1_ARAVE|nr:hypothetical protein AVEN_188348-1 [Araneus ventricosus]
MDILVRFWHNGQVTTRYLTSVFIGHAKADEILSAFYQCVEKLKLSKLWNSQWMAPMLIGIFLRICRRILKKNILMKPYPLEVVVSTSCIIPSNMVKVPPGGIFQKF